MELAETQNLEFEKCSHCRTKPRTMTVEKRGTLDHHAAVGSKW